MKNTLATMPSAVSFFVPSGRLPVTGNEFLILTALLENPVKKLATRKIIETVKRITEGRINLPLGGIYVHLHRLEKKGLISFTREAEATPKRGGRRRFLYRIEAQGIKVHTAVASFYQTAGMMPAYT